MHQDNKKKSFSPSLFPSGATAGGLGMRAESIQPRLLWPGKMFEGCHQPVRLPVADSGDPNIPTAGDVLGAF